MEVSKRDLCSMCVWQRQRQRELCMSTAILVELLLGKNVLNRLV